MAAPVSSYMTWPEHHSELKALWRGSRGHAAACTLLQFTASPTQSSRPTHVIDLRIEYQVPLLRIWSLCGLEVLQDHQSWHYLASRVTTRNRHETLDTKDLYPF